MRSKILWTSLCLFMFISYATAQITGKVHDEYGPVQGALVSVMGADDTVETGEEGEFSIPGKVGDRLRVINPNTLNEKFFDVKKLNMGVIKLLEKEINLEVVVGFGTQKKENLTGAVSTVDAKALEDRPVSNVVQALQGAVTGMNFSINNSGGELGNSPNFNIRGVGSIGNTSSAPLVLIDGMPGNFAMLNPQDIESVSVLKDAAASSIYGSRAAFGVILVKTKSAKQGKVTVTFNTNYRMSSPLLVPDMLDSETFATYWNEAGVNSGTGVKFKPEILEKIKKYKRGELPANEATQWNPDRSEWFKYTGSWGNVNWFKEFYREWTPATESNISVSGGTEKFSFYLSGNWLNQEGLMRYNNDTYDRKGIVGKFSAEITPWLRVNYKSDFTRIDNASSLYQDGLFFHNIARRWPTVPVYDPNGHYINGNEIAHLLAGREKSQTDQLQQQLGFLLTPLKGWNTHIDLNYKLTNDLWEGYALPVVWYDDMNKPQYSSLDVRGYNAPGETGIGRSTGKSQYINPNIYSDYSFTLNKVHNFKAMAGFQSELMKYLGFSASRKDFYTTDVISINTTSGDKPQVGDRLYSWATAGFFGRLNYDLDGRYLVEVNLRYDGSSRYKRDLRWNFYTSASLGWNMAREPFWEKLGGFASKISTFKPRFSYGELGNQNLGGNYYPYYSLLPVGASNGNWLLNGERPNTAGVPGLISGLLSWEKVSTANYGLDINMFKNRLGVVFDYFVRKTKDMVGPGETMPATLGTSVPKYNNTDMESKGFELSLSWNDRLKNGFGYGAKLNLTDSRQTITNYPNDLYALNNYYNGEVLNDIWGYTTIGIAKTQEEMDAHLAKVDQNRLGSQWAAGDIMYADLNGDGKIDGGANTLNDHGDLSIIGNSTPRYNFGLNLYADYKGFDFSIFLQGTAKRDLLINSTYFKGANENMWQSAAFTQHLDYFRPADTDSPFGPNVDAYYPRPLFQKGGKNFQNQTRWMQDASYMRIKNMQIGYTLPKDFSQKLGISRLRFYISGENLATFTKMSKIFDPETTGGGWGNGKIYPLSKVISTGINLTF
uniref:SusC/RagA family TonB-linked outer membrane protein n=1 Tax=Ornithobacterium rhinotracheale TaxID=28251 RepID=UPI0021AA56E1|nr:TonB-dependent receptor [Ornithobacterium rhinotracheale]